MGFHLLIWQKSSAQAKLVINGGIITLYNNASLVIDNPDNTAITWLGSGRIQSESDGNKIIWAIGTGNGNAYLIPFGNAGGNFPLLFNAASGIGTDGRLILNTFPTPTWKNSDYLPPGVANVNNGVNDSSAKIIDRFWMISPQGYSKNPSLSNLVFKYLEIEYGNPNTIQETNLIARRWNSLLQSWTDYIPPSIVNTSNNTVTVSAIDGNELYDWWTLGDMKAAVSSFTINFKADPINYEILTSWQTFLEQNVDHFEVWRSKDNQQFENAGSVTAVGNGISSNSYSFPDPNPYTGISYYKLKTIFKDGSFIWSEIVSVTIEKKNTIVLYPNPATNYIYINTNSEILNSNPVCQLYDVKGSLLQVINLGSTSQRVNTVHLPVGTYVVRISYKNERKVIRFIKK